MELLLGFFLSQGFLSCAYLTKIGICLNKATTKSPSLQKDFLNIRD
jgi:hypothetical protein